MLTYPRFVRLLGYPGKPVINGLKSMLKIGPLNKQIIDAIGSLRNLDLNQQKQVWYVIQSIIDNKSATESVTLFS